VDGSPVCDGCAVSLQNVVHVWRIPLDSADPAGLLPLLDARERRRAAGFVEAAHRRRFVLAHGVTRLILGGYLGVRPGELRWRLGRCGKPELVGAAARLRVNLSHSADLALLAITEGREVGVDVERVRDDLPAAALAARYFTPEDAAPVRAAGGAERAWWFLRLWTRKEACVKASGGRLPHAIALPSAGLAGAWTVRDLPLADGCVGAVALTGGDGYQVLTRAWPGARRFATWLGPGRPDSGQ
jgi:4'-phosphopantetheinyl transferase